MGWLNDAWTRRIPISVDSSAGGASGDVDITIPPGLDDFWDRIDTSGNELRVTSADGETTAAYAVDDGSGGSFSKSSRLGRLRLDGVTLPGVADSTTLFWFYYGSTSDQGTGAVSVTMSSILTGRIETPAPAGRLAFYSPQTPFQTRPRATEHKRVDEEAIFTVVFGSLATRSIPGRRSFHYEEPWYAVQSVLDSSGVAQSSMIDATRNRFVYLGRGVVGFQCVVKAGTTANSYTTLTDLRTVVPGNSAVRQRLIHSSGVYVRDVRW